VRAEGERCPDNLLARSRRGQLSQVELRALQAHAAICGLCRAALALGALHDAIPDSPEPGDQALVARLASQVAARHTGANPRRGDRPRVWAAAAALALLASAGGAAAWVALRGSPPSPAAPTSDSARRADGKTPGRQDARANPRTTSSHPDPDHRSPGDLASGAFPPPAPARRRATVLPATDRAPVPVLAQRKPDPPALAPGAADLFAAANAARAVRDLREAVSRYRLLQARYPQSPEAQISYLSAGDLLAQLVQPAAALDQFDRYLAARPAGSLAPEALFGRAHALQALDRRAAETATWRDLLRRYPGSIYEAAGRRRLDELAR